VNLFSLDGYMVEESFGACGIIGFRVVEGYDSFVGEKDLPFVPLDVGVINQVFEIVGKRTAREGNGKVASFSDSVALGFGDKIGERVTEFRCILERVEHGCGGLTWHGD